MGWAMGAMMAMQAASSIAKGAGEAEQASAAATASRYQAAVAENNAAIARNNALMTVRIGQQKASQQELKNRAQMGAIIAAQAANGVDVNTGSAKQVQDSAHVLGRLDTETIQSDAAREAHAYETQARGFDTEARMLRRTARQQKKAGKTAMATSLLEGAGNMASTYMAWGGGMGGSTGAGAPTSLMTGANVLNTNYWAPTDTGTIY